MLSRRLLISSPVLALSGVMEAQAQQRSSLIDPFRLGVDNALYDSGLAKSLQQAFGRDTGVAVKLIRMPALPLLEAIDRGEVDAALANAPEAEDKLDKQGLVHDRHAIAAGDFMLVGPAPHGKVKDPASIAGERSITQALVEMVNGALAMPGTITFLSPGDGSGVYALEQVLWREAKLAPRAPWYVVADKSGSALAQARARGAYTLVERAAWLAPGGGAPLAVLVEGDPLLSEVVHVMLAFRVNHPAGKLFVKWLAGPKGRRVAAAHRGYRTVAA
jgi:tungstate transport system substrate-binding protein